MLHNPRPDIVQPEEDSLPRGPLAQFHAHLPPDHTHGRPLPLLNMDMSNLPPHLKMLILGHTDAKTREGVLKVQADSSTKAVPLFSALNEASSSASSSNTSPSEESLFSIDELQALETRGYIIKDAFAPNLDIDSLQAEVDAMKSSGTLQSANMNTSTTNTWNDPTIRGDLHHWLKEDDQVTRDASPQLCALLASMDRLRLELNQRCQFNSSKTQTQIACYPGGGARYVRHLDSAPGGPDRRLTCLFYLNKDWKPEHGGCLRLFFPRAGATDGDEDQLDVEPLMNRLIIFQSRTIPHEVMASFADRMAITMWFY